MVARSRICRSSTQTPKLVSALVTRLNHAKTAKRQGIGAEEYPWDQKHRHSYIRSTAKERRNQSAGPAMSNQRIQNTSGHVTNERPRNPEQKNYQVTQTLARKQKLKREAPMCAKRESRLQQKCHDRVQKKSTPSIYYIAAVIAELVGSFLSQRSNAHGVCSSHARVGVGESSSFHSERRRGAIETSGNGHERTSFAICGDLKWSPCVRVVVLFLSAVSQTFRVCKFGIIGGCLSSVWLRLPLSIRRLCMCCVAPPSDADKWFEFLQKRMFMSKKKTRFWLPRSA